jgi:hypothetical protein
MACNACDAAAPGCTTAVYDTHKTEKRRLQYRWHPLHGQQVTVCGVKDRSGRGRMLRCQRGDNASRYCQEIPVWMFDGAFCAQMRLRSTPQVSWASLLELKWLLAQVLLAVMPCS